jgi:SAM-dependent methyltransferase
VSAPAPAESVCAACASPLLRAHLRVGGADGPADLIPSTDAFGTALGDIVRCEACGHMQLQPMPAESELDAAYGDAASLDYVEEARGQRATAAAVLTHLERHVAPGRLLDLGSWVGYLLAEAETRGWSPSGVEPSEFASGFAREHLGLDVATADLFTADLPAHAYDAVVLGDVIEHLPRPGDALARITTLLRPGGVVCLMLPDAGSRVARTLGRRWWSVIPTHVQYFTRHSLRVLLERQGYAVLDVRTQAKAFTVRYYLERTGGYSPALARGLVRGATRLHLADRLWAPDFRDRMLTIARAPGP